MLRRKLRESLTAQIFCVITLILFAASAVTFGIIALATPMAYTSVVSDRFVSLSEDLADSLDAVTLDESGPMLDQFILDTGATVMLVGPDGNVLDTPSALTVQSAYEDDGTVVITTVTGDYVVEDAGDSAAVGAAQSSDVDTTRSSDVGAAQSASADGTAVLKQGAASVSTEMDTRDASSSQISYTVLFEDWEDPCTLYITPKVQQANPTIQALGRVAPWLMAAMLVFSLLCALFYSRTITRPIVRLSAISKHLAELDFGWKCGETRPDEIGTLGRSLDELSDRLSSALGELREANAALRRDIDRERELEQQRLTFFSAASHELKTPITILKGQLTGMLEGVDVYRDRDKYLARSLAVTGRMEGLVQEIMAISRMEKADFALHLEPVDLGELVAGQAELLTDLARQRDQILEVSAAPGAVLPGDRALLDRAVANLLSNAILYSPAGAVIRADLAANTAGAALTVSNTGVHIPEEALPRLFEAFYRVEASRNRATGGSGLGLYLVKMILDRHGAEYRMENTPMGVLVTVAFPAAVPAPGRLPAPPGQSEAVTI